MKNLPVFSATFGRIHPTKNADLKLPSRIPPFGKLLRFLATTTVTHRSCGFASSLGGDGCSQDQPTKFSLKESNISHLLKEGKSSFPATFQEDRISYLSCMWSVTLQGRIEKIPKLWMILNSQISFLQKMGGISIVQASGENVQAGRDCIF